QRMLALPRTTVYRESAPRTPERTEGEEPPLAEWVARIAPSAAPFVRAARPGPSGDEVSLTGAPAPIEARKAVKTARAQADAAARKGWWQAAGKRLGILAAGSLLIFAALQLASSGTPPRSGRRAPEDALLNRIGGAAALGGIATLILLTGRARKQMIALQKASRTIFAGDPEARKALRRLSQGPQDIVAAQAHLELALDAERTADLGAALVHAEQGVGRLSRYAARLATSEVVLPALIAERAFLLAASGRAGEADAELEALPAAYPFLACARFRVRLVTLVRRGELAEAARLVEQRALDLPLGPRDELLADAVRVAVDPASCGAGEVARVKEELRREADLRRWVEVVAPGVIAAVEQARE